MQVYWLHTCLICHTVTTVILSSLCASSEYPWITSRRLLWVSNLSHQVEQFLIPTFIFPSFENYTEVETLDLSRLLLGISLVWCVYTFVSCIIYCMLCRSLGHVAAQLQASVYEDLLYPHGGQDLLFHPKDHELHHHGWGQRSAGVTCTKLPHPGDTERNLIPRPRGRRATFLSSHAAWVQG